MTNRKSNAGRRLAFLGVLAAVVAVLGLTGAGRLRAWWYEREMRNVARPLNVLLVTLDTTRADRIGAYGWPQAETPHLDALAAQGMLFRQAYSHVPLTLPSHASIMTALLPTHHGLRDNGTFVLPRQVTVLADRFREAGYRTGAIVSAFVLNRRFGLSRGFETYDDDVPGSDAATAGDPSERSVRARESVDKALAWLGAGDTRPRFLWVHLYDPHAPYDAPEPFATRHKDQPYDAEIAYMDAQLGRLLSAVGTRGGDPWLTVIMGDHGEGLGDHQEMTHGYFVYSDTQRVPLIMVAPGRVPAGRTIDRIVRAVDVAPTILEISGLPGLPDADGSSLVRLIAGHKNADPGPAYLESFHPRIWWGAQELLALRTDRWLYIDAPRPELYDVIADPAERVNLAASQPSELDTLQRQLRNYAQPGAPIGPQTRLDPEATARLRSLGYLGSGAPNQDGMKGELPDAKDNGPLLSAVSQGQELLVQGRFAEALVHFREALAKNPRSASVQMSVADTLFALRQYDEAIAAYAGIAAGGGVQDAAYIGMSKGRLAQGQVDAALAVTRAGLDVSPDSAVLNGHYGDLLLRIGRADAAEQAFRKALASVPDDEPARWGLGVALSKQHRSKESVEVMLALAEASPRAPQARAAAEALERWADERLAAGVPLDARRGYEAVLRTGRSSVEVFLNLGLALWQLRLQSEALVVLDRGVSQFPDSADLRYRKGRVLQQLGRGAEAQTAFREALQRAPNHAPAAAALDGR